MITKVMLVAEQDIKKAKIRVQGYSYSGTERVDSEGNSSCNNSGIEFFCKSHESVS